MISDTGTALLYLLSGVTLVLIGIFALRDAALPVLSLIVGFWLLTNWKRKW